MESFCEGWIIMVAWINEYVLKGMSFWHVKIPQACSWSWRKLLKLRDMVRTFIRFQIGSGEHIFLWLDLWHPDGILVDKYGHRAIYDAGSQTNAKLSSVICYQNWRWPPAKSESLVMIQSQLPLVQIGDHDQPTWSISKTGSYTVLRHGSILEIKSYLLFGGG